MISELIYLVIVVVVIVINIVIVIVIVAPPTKKHRPQTSHHSLKIPISFKAPNPHCHFY